MTNKNKQILIHVIGCLAFLILPMLFAPGPGLSFGMLGNPHTQRELLGYTLMILFFYANYRVFIPIDLQALGLPAGNYAYQLQVSNSNGVFRQCKMMTGQ